MLRALTTSRLGLAATVAVATFILTAFALSLAPNAEAQPSRNRENQSAQVSYSSYLISALKTSTSSDRVEEVYAFPGSPCYIIRTENNLIVWERRNNGVFRLLEVKLNDTFRDIIFLDDNRTFIVHTKSSVGTYSIDKSTFTASVAK